MEFEPKPFGRFFLVDLLGEGGMAKVYLAIPWNEELITAETPQRFALKRLHDGHSQDRNWVNHLLDEAKITSLLRHPNIVGVLEMGAVGTDFFLTMEWVPGHSLNELNLRVPKIQKPIPQGSAFYILEQTLQALAYAHQAKDASHRPLDIVHRDVTPGNILVHYDGSVKLTDFGIAGAEQETPVLERFAMGKISYMAPEQLRRESPQKAMDIFSLGVVLYEMLTGMRPFRGSSVLEVQQEILENEPDFAPLARCSREIQELLRSMLEKESKNRPSAEEVRSKIHGQTDLEKGKSLLVAYLAQHFSTDREDRKRRQTNCIEIARAQFQMKSNDKASLSFDEEVQVESTQFVTKEDYEHRTRIQFSKPQRANTNVGKVGLIKKSVPVDRSASGPKIHEIPLEASASNPRIHRLPKPPSDEQAESEVTSPEPKHNTDSEGINTNTENQSLEDALSSLERERKRIALETQEEHLLSQKPNPWEEESSDLEIVQNEFQEKSRVTKKFKPGSMETESLDRNPASPVHAFSKNPSSRKPPFNVAPHSILHGLSPWVYLGSILSLLGALLIALYHFQYRIVTPKNIQPLRKIEWIIISEPLEDETDQTAFQTWKSDTQRHRTWIEPIERFLFQEYQRVTASPVSPIEISSEFKKEDVAKTFSEPTLWNPYLPFEVLANATETSLPISEADLGRIYVVLFSRSIEEVSRYPLEYLGRKPFRVSVVFIPLLSKETSENQVRLLRETLRTMGATLKQEKNGFPTFPDGYAEPSLEPLHPQTYAEAMSRGIPISPQELKPIRSLRDVRIGSKTAKEIGWQNQN